MPNDLSITTRYNVVSLRSTYVLCSTLDFVIRNAVKSQYDTSWHNMIWYTAQQWQTRTTKTPAFWDTLRRPMITHTRDSHQIPSQNTTKSKLQILQICQKFKFCKKLYTWHNFWSCLIRCINMKWIQPNLLALQSGHPMQEGQTDRRTDGVKPICPPNNFVVRGVW